MKPPSGGVAWENNIQADSQGAKNKRTPALYRSSPTLLEEIRFISLRLSPRPIPLFQFEPEQATYAGFTQQAPTHETSPHVLSSALLILNLSKSARPRVIVS